jgi:hypothetical protein
VVPKPKRMSPAEHMAITTLLVEKDKNLQAALKASYEALGKFLAIKWMLRSSGQVSCN